MSECAPARFSGLQCGPPLLAHDGCAALSCGEGLCICELENCIAEKPGLFREQLMREDTARLRKLEALARSTAEPESYRRAWRQLGWTTHDARTSELGAVLDELLDAVREATVNPSDTADARTVGAWRALAHLRMERLVGCLATLLPEPTE